MKPASYRLVNPGFALLAGALLRFWMLRTLFEVDGDSLIYGGIAKNLLTSGRYALTTAAGITYPSLIRLPGYPFFLAICFKLFGMENYFAPGCVQIVLDLAGCLLLADFTRQITQSIRPGNPSLSQRAGLGTLWISSLCPFTASYAFRAMAEAPTLFALALAMWAMAKFWNRPRWGSALAFTFAVTFATLLRPDGALAAFAFTPMMLLALRRDSNKKPGRPATAPMLVVCFCLALAPFAAWTWRNWKVFHVFQPLAPRLATEPGESTNPGWERWIKSWCLDFVSTYEVYWNVPDDKLDVSALPSRAFDSPEQYSETAALAADYNDHGMKLTADIDARFARLADQRIADHPLRYYLWLSVGRMLDMWLRPRVENLPIDLDWWAYGRHHRETVFAWIYVALNAAYLSLALYGFWLRPRFWPALVAYILLRSALLLTVEAPEARYTLECFPMIFAFGGIALAELLAKRDSSRIRRSI
jgi:hypothetical protein